MNLTQAEAELIKARREAKRIQVETDNRALDDAMELVKDCWSLGPPRLCSDVTTVINSLRKEVPK